MDDRTITLVEDGNPTATIVVERDADPRVRDAVADLVASIATMSGATLPVRDDDGSDGAGAEVHVGRTAFVRASGLMPPGLPVNGHRIVTADARRLAIAGGGPIGVAHGVYDLLATNLGVLWGMASPLFADVLPQSTVRVPPVDRTSRRRFGFGVFVNTGEAWCRRNRIDPPDRSLPYYGHNHNMHAILPPDQYRDHPEYFALIDGERRIPENPFGPQPCMTHPDVIRIGVDAARRFFDEHPTWTTFSLCPNDTREFCRCPSCAALDDGREPHRGVRQASDSYYHFVEGVAREVAKSHPDRYLGTYGYWATALPPRRAERLPPNIVVFHTIDSSQYHDPAYARADGEIIAAWRRVVDHVAIYDYYDLGWFMPRVWTRIAGRTLLNLSAMGIDNFYNETYPYWAHTGPQLYLAGRLVADTEGDPAKILDEWYARMFREAAEPMRAYFEELEDVWARGGRPGKWFQGFDWIFEQFAFWPPDARERVRALLDAAQAAARTPLVRERIEYVRKGHRPAYLMPVATERALALDPSSPALEADIRGVAVAFAAWDEAYRKDVKSDATYGSHYYIGTTYGEERNFVWWKAFLGDLVERALAGRPDLRARLLAEDATLADVVAVRARADADVETRLGWAHREFGR